MKRIITFILIGIIVLIITGLLFLFSNGSSNSMDEANPDRIELKNEDKKIDKKNKFISYSPCESFITNIKDSSKYLKIKLALELKNDKSKEYFEKNNYKIKDIIISVLRCKTEKDLIAQDSLEMLRDELKEALNTVVNIENLTGIYIEEFIIQ